MDWSDPEVWDGYKPPPPYFNRGQVPSLRDNDHVLWTSRHYRGTSLRKNSSTGLNPSPNPKLRLHPVPPMANLANLRVRYSSLNLAIHSDGLLGIFWRLFRKKLNPRREKNLRRRPLSQRNCLRHRRQPRRSLPPALTPATKILHLWRTTQ